MDTITGYNTGGGRAGPGGDCEAIGEAPLVNVGSFTKRSEVKRRATLTNKWIQSLDITLEGAEQAREAIAKQSARPPSS